MGQRLIDVWAGKHIGRKFVWGETDCHQLLYQFVKLMNPKWGDPHNLGALRGTYKNKIQAIRVARKLDIPKWFDELGYDCISVNKIQTGDIAVVKSKDERISYDMYWPVIANQTVIVGDPTDDIIKQRHIGELGNYDYKVYRRRQCQEQ